MQDQGNSEHSVPVSDAHPNDPHIDTTANTLKELLAEINREDQVLEGSESGKEITLSSLNRTLAFLGDLTGKRHNSVIEPLPYSFLRTVKILYLCSRSAGDHIFEYLALPDPVENTATFEFRLSGQAPRNETKMGLALDILSQLGNGISELRKNQINGFLLTRFKLLQCIRLENDEILAPICALPPELYANGTAAIARVAEHIRSVKVEPTPTATPVDEALYTRILTLPFLHFVGEYQVLEELAALDFVPKADDHAIRALCQSFEDPEMDPYQEPFTSIAGYPDLFEKHATALIKLVSTITTLPIQKRDLTGRIDHVQKVLHLHVFNVYGPQPLDAKLLTVADVVAAMCTVAHQQKIGTRYEAHWQGKSTGNGSKAHNVLNQLDPSLSIDDLYEEDYVPEGVNRLLLNRLNLFHAWMHGYQDRHHALRAFELARLAGYAQYLMQTDIDETVTAVDEFNQYCIRVAMHWAHEASAA